MKKQSIKILTSITGIGEDAVFFRMLKNSGWLLSANSVNAVFALFQSVIVARSLGVYIYGVMNIIITLVTLVNRITSFRMGEFVIKYVSDALSVNNSRRAGEIIKFALIMESTASIIAFILALLFARLGETWFIHDRNSVNMIFVYSLIILINLVIETSTGILQVFEEFRVQSISIIAGRLSSLLATVFFYFFDYGIYGFLCANLIGAIVPSIILIYYAIKIIKIKIGIAWNGMSFSELHKDIKDLMRFAFSTNISATLGIINKESDMLWIGFFCNPAQVGYFKLAITLSNLAFLPIGPLVQTIYPEIAVSVSRRKWKDFRRILIKGSVFSAIYVVPTIIIVGISSWWIIGLFYGDEYTPAALALDILLIGNGFANIFFWSRQALLALGRADFPAKISTLMLFVKISGVLLLVPLFGYIGSSFLLTSILIIGASILIYKTHRIVYDCEN